MMASVMKAALLAGGRGSRMWVPEGLGGAGKLDIDLCGLSLCRRAMAGLAGAFTDPFIVTGFGIAPKSLPGGRAVQDFPIGTGPAAGIAAALQQADDWCFVAAADMPFLDPRLISMLRQEVEALPDGVLCAIPHWSKGREPLHAFYRKGALNRIISFLETGRRSLNELSDSLDGRLLDAEEAAQACGSDLNLAFFNVNTLKDLEDARKIIFKLGIQNKAY